MTYAKQIWSDNNVAFPADATRLSYIEEGIFALSSGADTTAGDSRYVHQDGTGLPPSVLTTSSGLTPSSGDSRYVHQDGTGLPASVATVSSPTAIYATSVDASFQAFLNRIPAGGKGIVPGTAGTITLVNSVTISNSCAIEFEAGAKLSKSGSFTDAQAILITGAITVEIEAPIGSVIQDGNQVGGAAGFGVVVQSGATVVMHGGVLQNNKTAGLKVVTGDVCCYDVESSFNVSGSSTADGFEASGTGAKLRTWRCIARQNDRDGFFFDRMCLPGCRLDGYAFGNQARGASVRSFNGIGGQFVAEANVQGGLAVEFGGNSWEFEEVRAIDNGLGDSELQLATLNSNTTVNVMSAETWWSGQTIAGFGIPTSTTIVGPVTAGATSITISNAASFTGQTTIAIGNASGFGVELFGASRCQFGKIIERNNSGYGLAIATNSSGQTTTISNSGNAITSTQTVVPSTGLSNWPLGGIITIGSETIIYEGIVGNTFIGCTRGAFGTTAATAADGAAITQSSISQNNSIGTFESDNLNCWDSDPAIHMSGGSTRNHIGNAIIQGRTFGLSMGESFGAANDNSIGVLQCDTISFAIWRITNGSNNRIDTIIARDCWTANTGTADALLYFSAVDSGAVTIGNVVGSFRHRTITRPAPNATISLHSGASGCYIETPGLAADLKAWAPSGIICESFSRRERTNWTSDQATALSTGVALFTGGLTIPAGQPTASATMYSAATALSMGTNADGHFWYALIRVSDFKVLAVTNDTPSQTWAAHAPLNLAWTSTATDVTWAHYTPAVDTPVWIAMVIAIGTGGTPTMPTLSANSYNNVTSTIRGLTPVLVGTLGSGLTTPYIAGSTQGAPTNSTFHPYATIS